MVWVGESLVSVKGSRENEVAWGLMDFYEKSKTARELMKECSKNQLVLRVMVGEGEGETCRCVSENEVQLFWADCANELKQLCETALFEMNNSLRWEERESLKKKLSKNTITVLEYGYHFAVHEAPSTALVHDVLVEMRRYRPSGWGLKHRMTAAAAVNTGVRLETIFANTKHKASENGSPLSMKSKYMYAYYTFEEAKVGQNIKSANAKLKKITNNLQPPTWPQGIHHRHSMDQSSRWTNLVDKWQSDYGNDKPALRKFFAAHIQALDKLKKEAGWTIAWNQSSSKGTWLDLANEIARVDNLDAAWATQIANDLRAKYANY